MYTSIFQKKIVLYKSAFLILDSACSEADAIVYTATMKRDGRRHGK